MKLSNIIKDALKNIKSNKLRSSLTMLGLIVGISSVILLVGIGSGASNNVNNQISTLGTNIVTIRINNNNIGFKYNELSEFTTLDNISNATPLKNISTTVSRNTSSSSNTSVIATDQNYIDIMNLKLNSGRNISIIDIENKNKVCIIGYDTASTYFGLTSPVGEEIKLNGDNYIVIGVLKENGESNGVSVDESVIIPFSTLTYLNQDSKINNLYVKVDNEDKIDMTIINIENKIRNMLDISSDYFTVTSSSTMLEAMNNINNTMSLLLGGIASISLIVGGIGVMNVMLVSVSERTKEIGIRKSLGATKRDILILFLIESLTLCIIGGILGIVSGILLGELSTLFEYNFIVSKLIILLSLGVSILIGLVFGIFPAYKASLLNPIDALRME